MSAIDVLLNPRHRRACTYKAVQPYLAKPMPAIKLKYLKSPTKAERKRMAQETDMLCAQCGNKVAVLGAVDKVSGEIFCDDCAIDNYQITEGFKTREAAKAHRRRLFDVTYLVTERLVDTYLASHTLKREEDLRDGERQALFDISYGLQNMVPKADKIKLQNEIDQSKIERYYDRLIARWVVVPDTRLIDQ